MSNQPSGPDQPSVPILYLNGRLVPADRAYVPALDHGLLFGHGLFETMRAYQGKVFRLDDHLARLLHAAEELGISLSGEWDTLERAIHATLEANHLRDARVRLTVTAGPGPGTPIFPNTGQPTILISVTPLSQEIAARTALGYTAVIAPRLRSSQAALVHLKSTSYLENLLARAEAVRSGADEALLLNDHRCIAEGAMSNVFFVIAGKLRTPSPDCGLLRGITRQVVMDLAQALSIDVEAGCLVLEDTMQASEAFLTSSVLEVMPLIGVDGKPVGAGRPGEVTRLLATAYAQVVTRELGLSVSTV